MRHLSTILIFLATFPTFAPAAEVPEGGAPPPGQHGDTASPLCRLCGSFAGAESLPPILKALEAGEETNEPDEKGNTPLLQLCSLLEDDPRYDDDADFARALNEAIALLLRHGADASRENGDGCNAVFYLQSRPELFDKLDAQKLIPKELAVRIPYDEAALLRYMGQRLAQSELVTGGKSRAYLVRRYCTPAYARADKLLGKYLSAEMVSGIRPYALETTLAFMRLANAPAAEQRVNDLSLWEHAEHFLEEVPEHLLRTLHRLGWRVDPKLLDKALDKLDSMLPESEDDMIDCNAGAPMSLLLEMRAEQKDAALPARIDRFSRSSDSRVAYTALAWQLKQKGLPLPEPDELAAAFGVETDQAATLPERQRRLLECALVDSAIREVQPAGLSAGMVRRTHRTLLDMGMPKHAAILAAMTDDEGLTVGEESLHNLSDEYSQLHAPSPQVALARYILEHPEQFRRQSP